VAAPQQFIDGTEAFTQGVDSGIAPVLLKRSQCAWATDATFRGSFIKHRPAFLKVGLTLNDPTIDLTKLFQGACYYLSDEGIGYLVAQVGGRTYQFALSPQESATVFDRTAMSQSSQIVVTTEKNQVTVPGQVVLTNLSDRSGATYGAGVNIVSGGKFLGSSTQAASAGSLTSYSINWNNGFYASGTIIHVRLNQSPSLVNQGTGIPGFDYYGNVYFGPDGALWEVIGLSGNMVTLGFVSTATPASSFAAPSGIPMLFVQSSSIVLATSSSPFTAPSIGNTVDVSLNQPNTLMLNQVVTVGAGFYFVSAFLSSTTQTITQTIVTVTSNPSGVFDPNPPEILQSWLWQSENYVIINDGVSKPLIFDGVSTVRSDIPVFNGTLAGPFVVPAVGATVSLVLNSPFTDAVGRFIEVSPFGIFPFLMQVVAVDGNQVVATNISGASSQGDTVPTGTPVVSVFNFNYSGIVANGFTMPPADGATTVNIQVSPLFSGSVGDYVVITDGTGPLTTYLMKVTNINGNTITTVLDPSSTGTGGAKVTTGFSILSQKTQPQQLPVGRMGAYVQGRNWISNPSGTGFIVSDIVGGSSGTAQFDFRDAVLNWSENTATFSIPGGFGRIEGIIALAALDASLGQGPLQILCDNGLFTCSASTDATTWASTTSPILAPSVLGMGGVGQNAMAIANSDLLFKSGDGTLRDLQMARTDFIQWGRLPISKEVSRALQDENPDLFPFISGVTADNRFLIGCQPVKSPLGTYCQGLVSLDFDITSSLQGKLPSVYDGVWTGLNILQLVGGEFNGVQRTFAFVANTAAGTIELWELTVDGLADGDGTQPVTWSFETPVMFHELKGKGPFEFCSLQDGEIYISNLVGKATIKSWYRPDYDSCWHKWHSFSLCASNTNPVVSEIMKASGHWSSTDTEVSTQPQYRTRLGLGKPPTESGDNPVGRPPNFGRFFQMRFEITGSLDFMGALFMATPEPESRFARVAGQSQGEQSL
jgi:hypothetical protein